MTIPLRTRLPIRFRGRSYLALVLTPEAPLEDWFAGLDAWSVQSPGFFRTRPVVVDVSNVATGKADVEALVAAFGERGIRLVGIEGAMPSWVGPHLPPLFTSGREAEPPVLADAVAAKPEPVQAHVQAQGQVQRRRPAPDAKAAQPAPPPAAPVRDTRKEPNSLLITEPVRSGQSIFFPDGDVTVTGSVASGAEIIAGGSIHIYGALRGRAIAGCAGNKAARIFCRKMDAELLAIDGLYRTTEDLAPDLVGKPIQAWLEGDAMKVAALG